ncbi:MAG: glycosyltransferase family 4 protein [Chloroflexota bacterium]
MLIGIDASRTTVARRTGTENYTLHLIRTLLSLWNGMASRPHVRLYFRDRPAPDLLPPDEHVEQRTMPFPRLWTHLRLSWEMVRRPPDLLFVPAHVLPPLRPRRSIVAVHDLGYLHFPQAHRTLDRLYLDLSTRWNARVAAHILADSQATKADLMRHYATPAGKISVVYPGPDEALRRVDDPAAVAAVKAKYGITADYVLYLGTLQPRKNLARLVDAFARLHTQYELRNTQLILAGRKGWLYDQIFSRVQAHGLAERIVFTDYLPNADLPTLLSGARAFAFPSLYEGFGFPVLEAMRCGVPVVCANTSSLPEIAGDAALLIDPLDTGALAAALAQALSDEPLRAELIARGYAQAQRFSWDRAARQVAAVIEELSR